MRYKIESYWFGNTVVRRADNFAVKMCRIKIEAMFYVLYYTLRDMMKELVDEIYNR